MLKLMIVDDEAVIRSGIANVVDWGVLDIEVVGEAANGRDALNRSLLLRPDIVITDIKMPIIGGLEFARELLKKRPDTRVVLLTGYSDFEYMQQAIQIGVMDYLLKPVRVDELERLMQRLCTDINAKREEKNASNCHAAGTSAQSTSDARCMPARFFGRPHNRGDFFSRRERVGHSLGWAAVYGCGFRY